MDLFANHNLPFSVALVLLALLAIVQLIGLGDFSSDIDVDSDIDLDADGGVFSDSSATDALGTAGFADSLASIIGLGRVPFTIWLGALFFTFAGIGLGIQALADSLLGAPLFSLLAAAFAGAAALPATGLIVRPLSRILPQDETTAVGVDSLVGRRATISIGRAAHNSPARGQVSDYHGNPHQVMIEPHDVALVLTQGEEVLLVRRDGETFYAVPLAERELAPTV